MPADGVGPHHVAGERHGVAQREAHRAGDPDGVGQRVAARGQGLGPGVGRGVAGGRGAGERLGLRGVPDRRPEHAGLDEHDPHAVGLDLHAQRVGDALEGVLARAVPAQQRHGHPPDDRADVHDAPLAALAHGRQEQPGQPQRRDDVGLQLGAHQGVGHVLHGPELREARVVHQPPGAAAGHRGDLAGDLPAGLGVVDVEHDGAHLQAALGGGLVQHGRLRLAARRPDDVVARPGQLQAREQADAAVGPCHDDAPGHAGSSVGRVRRG